VVYVTRVLTKAIVVVAGIVLFHAEAQSKYGGAFEKRFFGRQPDARGEALGRGGVALSGDILNTFYNPAGLGDAIGLNFCTSFSE
jgi:hypothetical protein